MNFLPYTLPLAVSLKVLFSVLYSSLSTLLRPVLSSPPFHLTITFMQMIHNCSFLFIPQTSTQVSPSRCCSADIFLDDHNLLPLNSYNTEFLLTDLKQQLAKIHNSSINTTQSARNLGLIFYDHLSCSDQISSLSKSCYYRVSYSSTPIVSDPSLP